MNTVYQKVLYKFTYEYCRNSLAVLLYAGKPTDDAKSINEQMVESGLAWSKEFSQPPSTTSSLSAVDDVSSQHSSNTLLSSGPSPPPRTTKRLSTVDDDGLLRLNSNIILSSGQIIIYICLHKCRFIPVLVIGKIFF